MLLICVLCIKWRLGEATLSSEGATECSRKHRREASLVDRYSNSHTSRHPLYHWLNLQYCIIDLSFLIMLKFHLIRLTGESFRYLSFKVLLSFLFSFLPHPPWAEERFVKSNRVHLMSLLGDVTLILEADIETEMTSVWLNSFVALWP